MTNESDGGTSYAFTPVKVGPITLRNRFIRSGANEMMTRGSIPTQALVEYHRAYAEGGVALSTLAYIAVSPDGRTFEDQGIMNAASVKAYRAVTDAIHAGGAKASAQLTHGGSFIQNTKISTPRAMSASGGLDKVGLFQGRFFQREMTRADMDQVRDEFAAAARLAADAGFDAIELHMGHGYLLNQFISPLSNFRRDEYGGSAENRVRFPAEVLAAVKAAVGDRLAILAKINLADGVRKGATVEDAVVTARALEAAGADMLVLSGGRNIESTSFMFGSPLPYDEMAKQQGGLVAKFQFAWMKSRMPQDTKFRELYFLELARKVRAGTKLQLAYLGGVQSLRAAEQALSEGFDAVVMARALIHDPALVSKWQIKPNRKSGCTACNRCVMAMYGPSGTHCPEVGNGLDPALLLVSAGEETKNVA